MDADSGDGSSDESDDSDGDSDEDDDEDEEDSRRAAEPRALPPFTVSGRRAPASYL